MWPQSTSNLHWPSQMSQTWSMKTFSLMMAVLRGFCSLRGLIFSTQWVVILSSGSRPSGRFTLKAKPTWSPQVSEQPSLQGSRPRWRLTEAVPSMAAPVPRGFNCEWTLALAAALAAALCWGVALFGTEGRSCSCSSPPSRCTRMADCTRAAASWSRPPSPEAAEARRQHKAQTAGASADGICGSGTAGERPEARGCWRDGGR
mmetsp:Transcript_91168/g.284118  ORF Transcript_91168/g.284118 Transcript_91168/m.284118 type:complete len:203 (+) Transcript_91168:1071-1679(+)